MAEYFDLYGLITIAMGDDKKEDKKDQIIKMLKTSYQKARPTIAKNMIYYALNHPMISGRGISTIGYTRMKKNAIDVVNSLALKKKKWDNEREGDRRERQEVQDEKEEKRLEFEKFATKKKKDDAQALEVHQRRWNINEKRIESENLRRIEAHKNSRLQRTNALTKSTLVPRMTTEQLMLNRIMGNLGKSDIKVQHLSNGGKIKKYKKKKKENKYIKKENKKINGVIKVIYVKKKSSKLYIKSKGRMINLKRYRELSKKR